MVMVRGEGLEPLFGHCVDGGATRVTITSATASDDANVWQVGGQVAERGVEMDPATLIRHACDELRAAVPGFAEVESRGGLRWSSYRIDRAEGRRPDGSRPEGVAVREDGNVLTAWPTKLALAPVLAEEVAERIEVPAAAGGRDEAGSEASAEADRSPEVVLRELNWPAPDVAQPPWEQEQEWIADP
jgi:hypothetical protein